MHGGDSFFVRAIGAAIEILAGLDTMPNDFAIAMGAFGRQRLDGALETFEVVGNPVHHEFQGLVILVSANFTLSHNYPFKDHCSDCSLLRLSFAARRI